MIVRPRRLAVAVALVLAALVVAQSPAGAWWIGRSYVKITEQNLDFGKNFFVGAPLNSGSLDKYETGVTTQARLHGGYLYINNAPGTCARMRLIGYDRYDNKLKTVNGGTVCAGNGSLHKWSVDLWIEADYMDYVDVIIQVQNTNGGYTKAGSDRVHL